MTLSADSESGLYSILRRVAGVGVHVLCVGFTVFLAVVARPGTSLFSWHPFLMTFSFSFFVTEALLIFSPDSSPIQRFSHKIKGRYHWILQTLATTCALLGLAAIFYNKHLNNKPHFATWHGLVGLLTVLFAVMQSLGGVFLLFPKLARGWSLAKLKRYHAASGLVGYLLGCSSLLLGMSSLWFTTAVHSLGWYLAALCPIFSALVIMNQVTSSYMTKKRFQT
ncbi:C56D2 protein, partial [Polyodon spathula]|nr:cytochrome b561 domain-containing protein 2-like [Polyodon spathula]XP_041081358.1 cytochrome b561 domain-containing protein 2-like [Polyodon spathula]XP_041081359.1 cytochrome b561 domain-containing protein 2-like [Polyodon spathula]MBN3288608.1 C56D2 protein [Polyodon spathula]